MWVHSGVKKLNGAYYELWVFLKLLLNELRDVYLIGAAFLSVQVRAYFFEEVKTWISDVTNDATILDDLLTNLFWVFSGLLSSGETSCSLKISK